MPLSVPTLYVVIVANFIALGIVWLHFARSYPTFAAARDWMASGFLAASGAAFSTLRDVAHPLPSILLGNGLLIFAGGLVWMGVRRFYAQPIPWRSSVIIMILSVCALTALTVLHNDIRLRVLVYSIGQSITLAFAVADLLATSERRKSPGANLAAGMLLFTIAVHGVRSAVSLSQIDGEMTLLGLNQFQAVCLLLLVFAGVMANFGFVLMTIDRLRAEVADLAMIDDLTGIANRRHFLARLSDACDRSLRLKETFALLIVDLDGFKTINDGYGHVAGDECLRAFTRVARSHLRAGDVFARSGGDEFCVILPSTALDEAALVARNLIKACRKTPVPWNGITIPMTVSIGIAEWPRIARDPQKLIADADQALYAAKKQGRDRLAIYGDIVEPLRETA